MPVSPLSLLPDEAWPIGYRRILDNRFAAAFRLLDPASTKPMVDRIRDVRKRIKQLRALVRLLRPILGDEMFPDVNTTLRDAGRRLAVTRDAAALVATWEQVAESLGDLPPATVALHQALVARRDAEEAAPQLDGIAFQSVGASLRTLHARSEDWPLDQLTTPVLIGELGKAYSKGYRLWQKAVKKEATIPDYHEWRKRAKDTWYQLQVVAQLAPSELSPRTSAADALGKQLGWVQDLTILEDAITGDLGTAHLATPVRDALSDRIAIIRKEAQREARHRAPALYVESPRKFAKRLTEWLG